MMTDRRPARGRGCKMRARSGERNGWKAVLGPKGEEQPMPPVSEPVRRQIETALARFMLQYRDTKRRQQAVLRSILRRNADTRFGREHGFAQIRNLADFRRQVPIRNWAEVSPYIDQVFAGTPGVLTADPPMLFHQTSGTTGKNKMIPVTALCDRNSATTHRMWVYKALLDNPGLLAGRVLGVVNAAVEGQAPSGVPFGSVGGNVFIRRFPTLIRRAYASPHAVTAIPKAEARRYTLLRLAIARDCSFVFTGNPGAILNLFEYADSQSERLIRGIRDGTLDCEADLPEPVRAAVRPFLQANAARARRLEKAKAKDGRLRPADYWPSLSVLGCWIAGTVGQFSHHLRTWCGEGVQLRDVGYMASEGVFSIPQANDDPAGLLALHSMFFEFVPVSAFGRPDSPALAAHEVEIGKDYQIVLTTTGGLYRYAINDIVRVAGFRDGTPLIRFMHKGGSVKNIAGEQLNADHVVSAVTAAATAAGLRYRHFQVVPDMQDRRYVLHFEPLDEAGEAPCRALLAGIEREFGRANEFYIEVRQENLLKPAALRIMRRGWFDRITEDFLAKSRRESQFKPAVLVDQPDHPEMVERAFDPA